MPWPLTQQNRAALVRAKETLDVDYLIMPVEAKASSRGRVVALKEKPGFLCDFAWVSDPSNEYAVLAALDWALSDEFDIRATTVLDTLKSIFGRETRELTREEHAFESLSRNLELDLVGVNDRGVAFR